MRLGQVRVAMPSTKATSDPPAVFRAENSMTARHMTEFMGLLLLLDLLRLAIDKRTGLDLEMEITQHYHEAVDLIDAMLRSIFRGLQSEYRAEIDLVRTAFPVEDFVFPEKTVRLTFNEGVKLLSEDGWVDDARQPQKEGEDLRWGRSLSRRESRLNRCTARRRRRDWAPSSNPNTIPTTTSSTSSR